MGQGTTALINEPMGVFAFLAALVALVFWVSELPRCKKLFEVVPPVIYVYFLPMLATTAGITPAASPLYEWTVPYLLLFALLMLMMSVDLGSVARLGPVALFMVAAGTVGIVIGGPISLMLFKGMLPPDAWTGFAALSGSWIGGTANMVAIAESVGTSADAMGPVIVVDTVVGYGWMGVLIAMVGLQGRFDRRTKARTDAIEQTNRRLEAMKSERRPLTLRHAVVMIGFGMACAVAAQRLGQRIPALGDPTIISGTTWAILIVVTGGLVLSFTRLRELESVGASHLGYTALYLLLAGIGAQADLRAVLDAPGLPAGGRRLDRDPPGHPPHRRQDRARPLLLRRDRQHGEHRRSGLGAGRRRRLPPRHGPDRSADGGRGLHPGDLRGDPVRVVAGAGGGLRAAGAVPGCRVPDVHLLQEGTGKQRGRRGVPGRTPPGLRHGEGEAMGGVSPLRALEPHSTRRAMGGGGDVREALSRHARQGFI